MSASKIEWTDESWNPVRGCSRVSEGCRNCYAERQGARFSYYGNRFDGYVRDGKWTGKVDLLESKLTEPLRWRKPRRVFVNSMSDLFHEKLSDEAIDRVFAVMALCPQHTFQVLTKRPERMRAYMRGGYGTRVGAALKREANALCHAGAEIAAIHLWHQMSVERGLPNVWLGVSCEDQATADVRIPILLDTPAAVRFVSAEPLLGPIDLTRLRDDELGAKWSAFEVGLSWLIVGGESGPGARPCDVAWIRSIVGQCKSAGVACFVKQLGAWPCDLSATYWNHCAMICYGDPNSPAPHRWKLKSPKGGDPAEWPADLRVREFPEPAPPAGKGE